MTNWRHFWQLQLNVFTLAERVRLAWNSILRHDAFLATYIVQKEIEHALETIFTSIFRELNGQWGREMTSNTHLRGVGKRQEGPIDDGGCSNSNEWYSGTEMSPGYSDSFSAIQLFVTRSARGLPTDPGISHSPRKKLINETKVTMATSLTNASSTIALEATLTTTHVRARGVSAQRIEVAIVGIVTSTFVVVWKGKRV